MASENTASTSYAPFSTLSVYYDGNERKTYSLLNPMTVVKALVSQNHPIDDAAKCNSFRNVVGGMPGEINVFMVSKDADELYGLLDDNAATDPSTFYIGVLIGENAIGSDRKFGVEVANANKSSRPEFASRTALEAISYSNLGLKRVRRLGKAEVDGEIAITMVTLVDYRDTKSGVHVSKSYNVHSDTTFGGYYEYTKRANSELWTWDQLLDDLWLQTGVGGTAPKPGSLPAGTPDGIQFTSTPVFEAYDDVLKLLGYRLVHDPSVLSVSSSFSVDDLEYEGYGSDGSGNRFMMFRPWDHLDGFIVTDDRTRTESDCRLPNFVTIRFRTVYPDTSNGYDQNFPYYEKTYDLIDEIDKLDSRFHYFKGFVRDGTRRDFDADTYAIFDTGFVPDEYKGSWISSVTYEVDDYVTYSEGGAGPAKFYKALTQNSGKIPSIETSDWEEEVTETYGEPTNVSDVDARAAELVTLIVSKLIFSSRENGTTYQSLIDGIPGTVASVEQRIRVDGVSTRVEDVPWEFWEARFSEKPSGAGSGGGDMVMFMVSCYRGNGWYEVYKLDMDAPVPASEDVLDTDTGQKRIVQPWPGHTVWQCDDPDTNQWSQVETDGEGTGQTPNAADYPGIEVGDTIVTENNAPEAVGLCIPECYASQCTWEWQGGEEGDWQKVAMEDCETEVGGDDPFSPGRYIHGGCQCQKPAVPGTAPENGTRQVTACAAVDCSTESPAEATWQWKEDPPAGHFSGATFTPYWKLLTDCGTPQPPTDGACKAVPPAADGSGHDTTETIQCYPNSLCSWVTEMGDPLDLCCDELLIDGDPDTVPRQEGHRSDGGQASPDTYGDPVLAYSIDKMTQPGSYDFSAEPGTYGFMVPFRTGQLDPDIEAENHWAIVQWQRTLIKAAIPTSIQCCPLNGGGTEIKITAWSNMIVEGIYCGGETEPCEVP